MSDGILTISGYARFDRLHAEYNKLSNRLDKLQKEHDALKRASKGSEDQQQKSADKTVQSLGKLAAQYLTVRAAIQSVTAAIREREQAEKQTLTSTMSLAEAQRLLTYNMGPRATDAQMLAMNRALEKLGATSPLGVVGATAAGAQVISATQGNFRDRAGIVVDSIRATEPFFRGPENRENLVSVAGALLDLRNDKRISEQMTFQQSAAFMQLLGSQARITEPAMFKNLVGGLIASQAVAPTLSPEQTVQNMFQAGSLTAAIGSKVGDPSGEKTGTAVANLVMLIYEEFDKKGERTIAENLDLILANPRTGRALAEKAKGRSFMKAPQRELLVSMLGTREIFDKVLPELDVFNLSGAEILHQMDRMGTLTPEMKTAFSLQKTASRSEDERLKKFRTGGAINSMILGGEVEDGSVIAPLEERLAGPGFENSWATWIRNINTGIALRRLRASGYSPKNAALRLLREKVSMAELESNWTDRSMQLDTLNSMIREISTLPEDMTTEELREYREATYEDKKAEREERAEATKATKETVTAVSHAANSGAAAAHQKAQQE